MSNQLGKKLEQTLQNLWVDAVDYHIDHSANPMDVSVKVYSEKIKQAFIDEGWRNTSHYEEVNIAIDENGMPYPAMKRQANLMTGQEWFNKFAEEYQPWTGFLSKDYNDGYAHARFAAIEVAKKVAGIS